MPAYLGPELAEGGEAGGGVDFQDDDLAAVDVSEGIDARISIQAHVVGHHLQMASDGFGHLLLEEAWRQGAQCTPQARLRST